MKGAVTRLACIPVSLLLPWPCPPPSPNTPLRAFGVPQIGKVSVTRSLSDLEQYTWTVIFDTNLGDLPLMDIDFGAVTGSLVTCGVTQRVKGVNPSFGSGPGGLSEGSAIVTDMDNLRYTITGLRQVSWRL